MVEIQRAILVLNIVSTVDIVGGNESILSLENSEVWKMKDLNGKFWIFQWGYYDRGFYSNWFIYIGRLYICYFMGEIHIEWDPD